MNEQIPKGLLLFVASVLFTSTLTSCDLATDAGTTQITPLTNKITATPAKETKTVVQPPFPPPDFGKPVDCNSQYYAYTNVLKEELNGYFDQLTSEGYRALRGVDADYFAKDRIFLRIDCDSGIDLDVTIHYIDGSLDTHPGAVSCDEAKAIIADNAIKTVLEYPVPGLYRKTGAQLFYVGYQDKDMQNLQPGRYLILDKKAYTFETYDDEFMVYDIDADGAYELFTITPGFTSGVFTYGIGALSFEGGIIKEKYAGMCLPTKYCEVAFQLGEETGLSVMEYTVMPGNVRLVKETRMISVVDNELAIEWSIIQTSDSAR